MKRGKKKEIKKVPNKILTWFRDTENIFLFLILTAVIIVGIVDNNIEIIIIAIIIAFIYGYLLGSILKFLEKIFNKKN